jgi:tRNA1(Val) A37 N6-methylase TrmN6
MAQSATTDDALLDGRVRLTQPAAGYRVAIDPVLLAAAVPAQGARTVLDAGAGVGAAALCLAARLPSVTVDGVELQAELAALFDANVAANGMAGRVHARRGDLFGYAGEGGGYDHVMTNPPYQAAGRGRPAPSPSKRRSTVEDGFDLARWVDVCVGLLRPKGTLTIIHDAGRLVELLAALAPRTGDVRILPLWPRRGQPARRVIVQARRGVASPATLLPGLVLHGADGRFTRAADRVLRRGEALDTGR